jgi:hypothetical protein
VPNNKAVGQVGWLKAVVVEAVLALSEKDPGEEVVVDAWSITRYFTVSQLIPRTRRQTPYLVVMKLLEENR